MTTGRQAGHDHLHARIFVRTQAGTVPVRSLGGTRKTATHRLDALHLHTSREANEHGRGMGHLWISCDTCHIGHWETMYYEPPHDIRHHRAPLVER